MTHETPPNGACRSGPQREETPLDCACRLFDLDRIGLSEASRLAGVSRDKLEAEFIARGIPIYRPTVAEFREDLRTLADLDDAARVAADAMRRRGSCEEA